MRTLACLSTSPTALRHARIAQRSRGETIIFFLSTANKMESNRVNCILRRRGEGTDCRQRCLTAAQLGLFSAALSPFAGAFLLGRQNKNKKGTPSNTAERDSETKTRTHGTTRRDFVRRAKTEHAQCWELPKHSHHHHIQSSSSLWHSVFFFLLLLSLA